MAAAMKRPPEPFRSWLHKYAKTYDVSPLLAEAVMYVETGGSYNPMARGRDGEYGLMQLLPGRGAWGAWEGATKAKGQTPGNPMDPETNIMAGCWFLGKVIGQDLRRFGLPDTVETRIIAYNAGIGRVLKGPVPASTLAYVKRVREYLAQHGEPAMGPGAGWIATATPRWYSVPLAGVALIGLWKLLDS